MGGEFPKRPWTHYFPLSFGEAKASGSGTTRTGFGTPTPGGRPGALCCGYMGLALGSPEGGVPFGLPLKQTQDGTQALMSIGTRIAARPGRNMNQLQSQPSELYCWSRKLYIDVY